MEKKIYMDSCIVIYLVERHPIFAPIIQKASVGCVLRTIPPRTINPQV
jgi:hypothetical protein